MNYNNRIVDIQCPFQEYMSDRERTAHKIGHRDARHAAAEISSEADATIEELVEALELILDDYKDACDVWVGDALVYGLEIIDKTEAVIAKAKGE